MPLNVPITEDMVRGLAPDDATWAKAGEIAGSDRLVNAGVSADGTWLLADAKGAAKDLYHVSADFVDPNKPVLRSTSPARQAPDQPRRAPTITPPPSSSSPPPPRTPSAPGSRPTTWWPSGRRRSPPTSARSSAR